MSDQVRIRNLVEAIKQANTAGWVCDSIMKCKNWEIYGSILIEDGYIFNYCPYCGKEMIKNLDKLT